jgi:hypothetical protein
LRDLSAARVIALLTDPLLLRRGPADPARSTTRKDFLLRVRRRCIWKAREPERAQSRDAGADGRQCSISRCPSSASRRAADERLLPHARIVHRSLDWARKTAPVPVGANLGLSRDGSPVSSIRYRRHAPAVVGGAFQAAIDAQDDVAEEALSCIQQHVDRIAPTISSAPAERTRCCTAEAAAALRPSVGDARLRPARSRVSRVPGRSRGASCATSITSTRSTSTRC